MRHAFLVALFCFIAAATAVHAQDDRLPSKSNAEQNAQVGQNATRIEADADSNVIRFFINGQEQAVLDAEGLHVDGSIDYTGGLTDGNKFSRPVAETQEAP